MILPALVLAGCGGKSSQLTGPTGKQNLRVVAIGDSITQGNSPGDVPYPARLERLLQSRNPEARVINRGVGGQRTGGGLATVAQSLATDGAGYMLIMEGTNDVRTGVSVSEAAENLRLMVRQSMGNQVIPILATVPPQFGPSAQFLSGVLALNDLIRKVAADERVTLAEVFQALPDESFFQSDGLHPNAKGDATIAGVFDAGLATVGYPTTLIARGRR